MRYILFIMLLTLSLTSYSQNGCNCPTNPDMKEAIDCDTIHLKNQGKLYYQFNCDSVWLTYELKNGKKFRLSSVDSDIYQYTFRIGYQFSKEYRKSILFRSGCPANGPCNFILINKANGKVIRELGELIYDHDTEKFYDFVVYFVDADEIAIDFIDNEKKFYLPINAKYLINDRIPEYSFGKVTYKKGILTLYPTDMKLERQSPGKVSFNIGRLRNSLNHPSVKKSAH